MNTEEVIKKLFQDIDGFSLNDVPDIDLYMDQVTTYLNKKFESSKKNDDDKLLTKTMINNYAKSHLLPPPEKKKYSKDHVLVLAMIFFYKNIITINDIATVISPLLDYHFHADDDSLEKIVNIFLEKIDNKAIMATILEKYNSSTNLMEFTGTNEDYYKTLELITSLCYDVYIKKMLIERLIVQFPTSKISDSNNKETEKSKEKGKEKKEK